MFIFPLFLAGFKDTSPQAYQLWEGIWQPVVDVTKAYLPGMLEISGLLVKHGYEERVSYAEHIMFMSYTSFVAGAALAVWTWKTHSRLELEGAYRHFARQYFSCEENAKWESKNFIKHFLIWLFLGGIAYMTYSFSMSNIFRALMRDELSSNVRASYVLHSFHENNYGIVGLVVPAVFASMLVFIVSVYIEDYYQNGKMWFPSKRDLMRLSSLKGENHE